MICYYCAQIAHCTKAQAPLTPGVMVCDRCRRRTENAEAATVGAGR